jgi:hypothetical protein
MPRIEDWTVESLPAPGALWILLERLNTLLERAYSQADLDTGC